jgi:hypothetical protein
MEIDRKLNQEDRLKQRGKARIPGALYEDEMNDDDDDDLTR